MDVEKRLEDLERRLSRVEAELRLEAPKTPPAEAVGSAPAATPLAPPRVTPPLSITPDVVAARLRRLERDTLAPSSKPESPAQASPGLAPAAPAALPHPVPSSASGAIVAVAPSAPSSMPARPALVRPPAARAARPPAKTSIDYERFVGVAVLGRVGIAAVLLAAGYFGQLGWKEIGPWGKVSVVYGLAVAFIAAGTLLRAKVSRLYLALLWGGGTAAMYLAGALAKLRFGLVGPTEALGMLVAACAVGQFLASRAKIQVLAITALMGAFAAPVIVGGPEDARTALCVYLLALHGWSAFTEAKFGWKGARLVGVVGTGIVGLLWLGTHGRADVSTMLHVQAYLFGLTLPEWGGALLGRPATPDRARTVAVSLTVLEVLAFGMFWMRGSSPVLSQVLPGVALAWTCVAVAARARVAAPTPMSTVLARLAACLLVPASVAVWAGTVSPALNGVVVTAALASLAGLALVLMAARTRFGLGEGGPLGASAFSILLLLDLAHPDARLLLALVPPAVLVGWARDVRLRSAGYVAGVAAIAVGFLDVPSSWWTAAEFGAFAAWAVAALSSRRLRPSDAFDVVVDMSLVGLVVQWTSLALNAGPFLPVPTPFYNPGTAAALALAAALVVRAPWRGEKAFPRGTAPLVGAALVALGGLVAWRELHAALAAHASASAQAGVETFFFVAASVGAIALGRKSGVRAFAALAGMLLVAGISRTIMSFEVRSAPWWIAAELGALAAGGLLLGATARRGEKPERIASALVLLATVLLWVFAIDERALSGASLLANPRFASGVLLAVALAVGRFEGRRGLVPALVAALGVGASIVGFEAGRREVVAAVTAVDSEAWKAVLVSLYAALFAGGVLTIGFLRRAADLRWLALAGLGGIVLKVGLHDLASVSTPLRILVTGCLGLVLLTAAYAYARGRRTEGIPVGSSPDPAAPPDVMPAVTPKEGDPVG